MNRRTRGWAPIVSLLAVLCHGCKPPAQTGLAQIDKGTQNAESAGHALFRDVSAESGINYRWRLAAKRPLNILQTIGNGCAFLDYNNDGNLDILLVGQSLALYKGDGKGHFLDVTHATGLDRYHGDFLGCAVGDYDNDGYEDLYITGYHAGLLLHNEGGKYFRDMTRTAGLSPLEWSTSASFVDLDHSGRLDLFVCCYVDFGPTVVLQLCEEYGYHTACPPHYYKPLKPVLYRNVGGGKFVDVSQETELEIASGNDLGVACADFDESGAQSVAVANDGLTGNLLTLKNGKFVDTGASSGVGYTAHGNPMSGMGVDWGDYNNDGKLDLAIATFADQVKPIFRNDGKGLFDDQSTTLGLTEVALPFLPFGVKWLDYDNDGWLDIMYASGHIADNIGSYEPGKNFLQPTLLFHNDQGQHFTDVSKVAGSDLERPIMGRGLAVGDFDNDGRVDALVVDSSGAPLLLHNETLQVGNWLEINLIGVKSNHDGYGAIVEAIAGSLNITRLCHSDGSYLSASDKRVHLGLGASTTVTTLSVRWPSGHIDTYHRVAVNRVITIKEGAASVLPRYAWK